MIKRDHPILDAAEVAPRLWIGSHPPIPGHRCGDHPIEYHADVGECGFGFLALCAQEYQPDARHFPAVEVCYAPFDDNHQGLTTAEFRIAKQAAEETVAAHRRGKSCLVTCMAGRNRSGLVTAMALAELAGVDCGHAGQIVRDKRGLGALTNPSFRGVLQQIGRNPLRESRQRCELCEAKPLTRRYWEDGICWIADCKTCGPGVPMAVYREHGRMPSPRHLDHMLEQLRLCAQPGVRYRLDDSMESIPDHFHVHLRPVRSRRRPLLYGRRP